MESGQSVLKVNFIALNTLITEYEIKQINYLRNQLKKLENETLNETGKGA